MNRQSHSLVIPVLGVLLLLGCGLTDQLVANTVGGAKGNTVPNLWSDVPSIQGSQKQSVDLPITVRLGIQALIKSSAASQGGNIDQLDWIAYSTSMTPQQVAAFYTADRMKAMGWNMKDKNQPGCINGGDTNIIGGAFRVFTKGAGTTADKGSVLFIIPV